MAVTKENTIGNKNPLFLRFINRETGITEMLFSFSQSSDPFTAEVASRASQNPPDLEGFRKELEEAVRDIIKEGFGEDFKAFVNHYMEPSIVETVDTTKGPFGMNHSQVATVKDEKAPWIQGLICYNLCLYIKAFGLEDLKSCKICGKIFAHKGKYAVYCDDACKAKAHPDKKSSKDTAVI